MNDSIVTTLNEGFSDFGIVTQDVSFDYQYISHYEEIHEENELFH